MGALTGVFHVSSLHLQIYKKSMCELDHTSSPIKKKNNCLSREASSEEPKNTVYFTEVFHCQTSFCQWHSFLDTGSIQNICKCNTQHEGKSIPQRKREPKPQTSFYTWSQTAFWCLRHTRMALSGEQRSRTPGRRLYTVEPLGHGEAGCRLTPGY